MENVLELDIDGPIFIIDKFGGLEIEVSEVRDYKMVFAKTILDREDIEKLKQFLLKHYPD